MPLLNYTTTIEADKTVAQIQAILVKHGAKAILAEYGQQGNIETLAFKVNTPHGEVAFKLPVYPDSIQKVLTRQRVPFRYCNHAQAIRIAWRIVKDWVEAQMALLETEMVRMEQIFLPYAVTKNGKTLYENLVESRFKQLQSPEEASPK